MNKPAMMDCALRLLRLLNEEDAHLRARRGGVRRCVRTAQRYLLYLAALPCVSVDEEKHTYSLITDYVINDKIYKASEMAMVCAMIDYATHIFGPKDSSFLQELKHKIFRMPEVYQVLSEEPIDMEKVASARQTLERHVKQKEIISFSYSKKGKRYTVEPYKILYHEGFWYLVGLHDRIVKKFVLDFIERVRPIGRTYMEIPKNIEKTLHEAKTIWFHEKEPDRVTVEFDREWRISSSAKSIFPRQEIVERKGSGNVVLSFDVHNEMDLREQVARWMPYFEVKGPAKYRGYIRSVANRRRGGTPTS
jgi:predicted DNA-binding transcriptional regulator YafY